MTNEGRNTLKLADGFTANSIQGLREHFDLISVLEHYTSGKLLEWLNELQLVEEAQAVASMNPFMRDFEEKLCSIFHVPFSLEETIALYEKGVAENCAEAQFRLGCCYLFAYGIYVNRGPKGKTKNHKKIQKGAELTELAAQQGHPFAQYSLGNFYRYVYRGDYTEWYQRAADQGYIEAQYALGTVEGYLKAAEQGHVCAQTKLGYCLYKGEGIEQNYAEAVKWYQKAAGQVIWRQSIAWPCAICAGKALKRTWKKQWNGVRELLKKRSFRLSSSLGNGISMDMRLSKILKKRPNGTIGLF